MLPSNLASNPDALARELYCRVLRSQFLLFLLGVVSVYTVVFLSLERWFAVHYPFKYRTSVSSSCNMKYCVIFIWMLGLLTNAPHLTEMEPGYHTRKTCTWKSKDYEIRKAVAFAEILLKFILPSLVLVLVLSSLYKKFHGENPDSNTRPQRERQLLRMCTATAFAVLLCWSPNQVYYLLYKFDTVEIGRNWHQFTVVLALSTSAINPIIYFVTSTAYRECLLGFLSKIFNTCRPKSHPTRTLSLADMEGVHSSRDNPVNSIGQHI